MCILSSMVSSTMKNLKDLPRQWNCPLCRLMPSQTHQIFNMISTMDQLLKKQSDNIEKVILSQKELARTNTNLIFDTRIATLDAKLIIMEEKLKKAESKPVPQVNNQQPTVNRGQLLIGTSIIRDTASTSKSLQISSNSGASVHDIMTK